ncbi:hypothetical protein HMN09_00028000 [Mycena chlorophos]|uniref:Cupredoxin n=1 Tax=Mycena chlorophos TaxID=658473 RepID=A0A8H6TVH0_MYCCL|nr:hypothetical protein HMN09_00028000 [Mycena chlorophos]
MTRIRQVTVVPFLRSPPSRPFFCSTEQRSTSFNPPPTLFFNKSPLDVPKMRFSVAAAAVVAAFPLLVSAQTTHNISVGFNNTLAFFPSNITAGVGDVINFQFLNKNHSVTQSTFADPCSIQTTPAQGIDSGFQLVTANSTEIPQWSFTVQNASSPLWFFCAQTIPAVHCHAGMVFSINADPNSAKSFAVYQQAAINLASASGSAATTAPAAAGASSVASAVGGAVASAASGGAAVVAGSVTSIAAAAASSDAAAALTAATSLLGDATSAIGAAASALTGAGFTISAQPVHILAAFGVAATLLL